MGRTCKPYTDSGPGQELFFFLLINVTTKQWNKITLFEDLLYSDFFSVENAIKQTSKQTTKKTLVFLVSRKTQILEHRIWKPSNFGNWPCNFASSFYSFGIGSRADICPVMVSI